MRRRILSKLLAVVLSAAVFLPGLSGGFVAAAAGDAGTTVIQADFSAAHSNWGALEGTGNDVASFDGQMKIGEKLKGNAFYTLTNWPDLPLKKVTIDIDSMLLDSSNDSRLRLLYRYNGAEDYEGIQLRNNGSKMWHLLFTEAKGPDAASGQSNDARQDTIGNGKYNVNTGKLSGMETGAVIVLDYSEAGYCNISFQNKQDATQDFAIKIKAVGKEFNTDGMQFALGVETGYNGASHYANINSVSFEFDGVIVGDDEAQKEADGFKAAHAAILGKTVENVTVDDRVAVDVALAIYQALSNEAKLLLTAEKANLDALKARISELSQAVGGYFEDDFESGNTDNWVALKDGAEGWGIADNPKQEINTSSKVFRPLANTSKPGDRNPWQEGYLFNEKHFPVYTLKDEIWTEQTAGGQKLASVSGDLYSMAADWNSGVMFIYWYQDVDNYKAIYVRRENAPDTQNKRDGASFCYAIRKVVKSSEAGAYQATAIKPGSCYSTVPANEYEWTHFVFDYAEDGSECRFILMDAYGNAETYLLDQKAAGGGKTEVQVKLNEGKFALSTMAWALTNYQSYIDNISFNFTGSAKDAAECFKADYARTIGKDVNTVMPEDKADIEAALAAFGALGAEAKGFLAVEQGKLQALWEAVNRWTGDLAASFRQIHADALQAGAGRTKLEAAWNVLRRLPAATQKELAAEKGTLVSALAAIAGSGTKKPIEIACIGDSLTWGSGAANAAADSWPNQLGELLGSGYMVKNYGVAGVQAAHIYNNEIKTMGNPYGNNLQLENTRTDGWMTSHINQADVVILMLGTNDAGKVCGENILKDPELAAKEKLCYMDAMKALIASYQALPSSPTIVLAISPVRMMPADGDAKKTNAYYAQEKMSEIQRELAAELGLPSIDIYALTKAWETEGTTAKYFNTDGLHFVRDGYTEIAKAFQEYVEEKLQVGFQTDNGGLTYVHFRDDEPVIPEENQVTGVTVAPTEATVHIGKTQTFQAQVSGKGNYSQAVTWTVSGSVSADTKIVNGTLTVGSNETAKTLTVTATSVGDNAKSATATVAVEQHNFGGDWKTDGQKHWKECSCGVRGQEADHNMGSWTVDGENHTRTCVCGKKETESHKYGAWTKADGSQHQRTCSVCQNVQKENHKGTGQWKSDKDGHWHACEVCGPIDAKAAHTPGAAATETTPQTCTTCDWVLTPALGHTHKPEAAWTYDDNEHWHACAGCKEDVKLDAAAHTYGEWVVMKEATETEKGLKEKSCVCGHKLTEEIPVLGHTHKFDSEWKSDETGHWHVCACGEMEEVTAHTYGEWIVTKEAAETEKGSRERSCSACGYKEVEEIPATGTDTDPGETEKPDDNKPSDEKDPPKNPDVTKPSDDKDSPKTGDEFPFGVVIAILVICIGVGTALIVWRRKKK